MQTKTSRQFDFWQRWLFYVSLAFILFSLAMSLLNSTPLFGSFHRLVDPLFWGSQPLPEGGLNFRTWIYGIAGATMTSWGVLMAFLTYYPLRRREKWAWNGLMLCMLAWYLPDTAVTLYFGVWFNFFFSTLVVAVMVVPLLLIRQHFLPVQKPAEAALPD